MLGRGRDVAGRPLIITGRDDRDRAQALRRGGPADADAGEHREPRHRRAGVAVGIDLKAGVLDVPRTISKLGWWLDGQMPGATSGSVLIAGHVDSATAGAGAFFRPEGRARRRPDPGDDARTAARSPTGSPR